MTAIENYDIDIIERTKEILEANFELFSRNDREFTFLVNCLLGIVVAATENEKRKAKIFKGKIDNEFMNIIPERVRFIKSKRKNFSINENNSRAEKQQIGDKYEIAVKSKIWLLTKLRNCIAHQHIAPINEDGNWVGVKLWNVDRKYRDFEIVFTQVELKGFCIYIANYYLNNRNKKRWEYGL
ncbi:MAG: hypothetical protein SCALA702_02070 [Melioribacteraceae bacterium]|nr:MAG: hypothetical protein SCALA702_02070 [Melioribacteraceae bacterium]